MLLQVAGGGGLVGAAVAGEAEPHVDGVVVVLEVGGGVGDMVALAAGLDWIRIQSGQWIRIQEGKNNPQK